MSYRRRGQIERVCYSPHLLYRKSQANALTVRPDCSEQRLDASTSFFRCRDVTLVWLDERQLLEQTGKTEKTLGVKAVHVNTLLRAVLCVKESEAFP